MFGPLMAWLLSFGICVKEFSYSAGKTCYSFSLATTQSVATVFMLYDCTHGMRFWEFWCCGLFWGVLCSWLVVLGLVAFALFLSVKFAQTAGEC